MQRRRMGNKRSADESHDQVATKPLWLHTSDLLIMSNIYFFAQYCELLRRRCSLVLKPCLFGVYFNWDPLLNITKYSQSLIMKFQWSAKVRFRQKSVSENRSKFSLKVDFIMNKITFESVVRTKIIHYYAHEALRTKVQ
jgi:hypothetical protein